MTDLIAQYRVIHANSPGYGSSSSKRLPFILPYVRATGARSIIDYGCGQSALPDMLEAAADCIVTRYDPALSQYAQRPSGRFDLLVSIDVLEHIPEPDVGATLADMASLAERAIIIVDTKPAATFLPDGRNAHVTLRPAQWWAERLREAYPTVEPIAVRRRPASFRTWSMGLPRSLNIAAMTIGYRTRERMAKISSRVGLGSRRAT